MKKRRILAALLAACALFTGCAAKDAPNSPAAGTKNPSAASALVGDIPVEFPLTAQPASLNVMITGYNGNDQEDVLVWREYEAMTGVTANWITVDKAERSEAVHTALVNGQSLDLILRCKVTAGTLTKYGENGLILDLAQDGLLQTYAPNCWAYLQSHPDALASVMNPDGSIYGLPQINSGAELRVAQKIYVNRLWMERLGLSLPATTEEFRRLLIAFRDGDANGNGDADDEIPLCGTDWGSVRISLFGAFGLANRGYHNETVDCDPETGGVRLVEASDQYRSFLAYMHGLYADGLIDEHIFTITRDQWQSYIDEDRVGVFAMTNLAWIPADKVDNWVAIDTALVGPAGDQLWSAIRANFHSTGAAVIPATCSDPALALRWLDYFWTDEGTLFYHMGVEGESYQALPDGTYDYLPSVYAQMEEENLPFDDVVAQYSPYPGGSNPTVEIAPYFMGGEMADVPAQAARSLFAYGPEEYWPSFTYTEEETAVRDAYRGDFAKYCDGMCILFITGEKSLEDWDEYIAQLDALGAAELRRVYQAAVDRYHALMTALNGSAGQ